MADSSHNTNKHGLGGVYRRGRIYWIRYWHRGVEYRESSGSDSAVQARKLLQTRLGQMSCGRFIGPSEERLAFADLAELVRTDYQVNARRSRDKLGCRLTHLSEAFAHTRAIDISSDRIRAYIVERQQAGAAAGSINRELAALKRAFNLAVEAGRLSRAPHFQMLEKHNARQGFVERAEFSSIRGNLPDHLCDPISFLHLTGWRVSEMQSLEWRDIDDGGQVVRLRPEHSKNENGREFPFSWFPELAEILARTRANRRLDCRLVFHRNGLPLRDFRKAWATACSKAGLGKVLVHDLRRTAVRNLVRAGVPERVAMELTGHKTRAVFERYNIVSQADRNVALQKLATYLDAQPTTTAVVALGQRDWRLEPPTAVETLTGAV
jgi:integrase